VTIQNGEEDGSESTAEACISVSEALELITAFNGNKKKFLMFI
jgi:hypothetical protein